MSEILGINSIPDTVSFRVDHYRLMRVVPAYKKAFEVLKHFKSFKYIEDLMHKGFCLSFNPPSPIIEHIEYLSVLITLEGEIRLEQLESITRFVKLFKIHHVVNPTFAVFNQDVNDDDLSRIKTEKTVFCWL